MKQLSKSEEVTVAEWFIEHVQSLYPDDEVLGWAVKVLYASNSPDQLVWAPELHHLPVKNRYKPRGTPKFRMGAIAEACIGAVQRAAVRAGHDPAKVGDAEYKWQMETVENA